ncbi:MAG: type II toxin-antitoxin system HigB family toxin [Armatimonadetes bacterium]|nr:type II toxin-antitoxin system HigB family toxin [Armatimonadota bacterium]
MRVVGTPELVRFRRKHADARSQIDTWLAEAENASWRTTQDIKARYSSASFLSDRRVIFNLKGNAYRLLVRVSYKNQVVRVLRIGTHAEYDSWELEGE